MLAFQFAGVGKFVDFSDEFGFTRPAGQVEVHEEPAVFGRCAARVQRHQQAGDDRDIQLKLDRVLRFPQQMSAAENVLEEAEEY